MGDLENSRMKKTFMAHVTVFSSLAMGAVLAISHGAANAADAQKGKAAYVKHGCWQCHGYEGKGGITGPALAPNTKPLAFISAFVRNTNGAMPPYKKAVLSDEDLADIHAYLTSLPKPPDYKTIPLLNP